MSFVARSVHQARRQKAEKCPSKNFRKRLSTTVPRQRVAARAGLKSALSWQRGDLVYSSGKILARKPRLTLTVTLRDVDCPGGHIFRGSGGVFGGDTGGYHRGRGRKCSPVVPGKYAFEVLFSMISSSSALSGPRKRWPTLRALVIHHPHQQR